MFDNSIFIPEVGQVHPGWYREWGKAIGAPDLTAAMYENPRLRDRVHEQLIRSGELDLQATFSQGELHALHAYCHHREKLARLCGMVVNGKLIRGNVSKQQFDQLIKIMPAGDLKIAVELRSLHVEDMAHEVDLPRIGELVARSGKACIASWKENLSPQMRLRVDLFEQPGGDEEQSGKSATIHNAGDIVQAVASSLLAQQQQLAA